MVSHRKWSGVLLAGLVLATGSAEARSGGAGDICERLRGDLAMVTRAPEGSSLDRQISDAARRLGDLEARLERQGCGGSIIVIRGGEGDICGSLEHEHQTVALRLHAMLDQRGGGIAVAPETLRAALADHGCLGGVEYAAGYSQFRSPGGAAIIDLPQPESSIQPATLSIEPEPDVQLETSVAPAQSVDLPEAPREVITLEERLANRDVRVVGPQFLPDQSEAIDLRSPVPTFFQ